MSNLIKKYIIAEYRKRISSKQIRWAINKRAPSLKAVETAYKRYLTGVQIKINKLTRATVKPFRDNIVRSDAGDPLDDAFNQLATVIADILTSIVFESGVLRFGNMVEGVNFKKYDKGAYKQIAINAVPQEMTDAIVNNWLKTNVGLIKNTNARQLAQMETLLRDNMFSGIRAKDLEARINKIYKGSKNNVALIARDQVGKLGGQLDRLKQTEAGVEGYYWRSSRDERVRSLHAHRDGNYYDWNSPPSDGHPGEPIQCRCDAEPAIDRMLMSGNELKKELAKRETDSEIKRKQAIAKSKKGPIKTKKRTRKTPTTSKPETVPTIRKPITGPEHKIPKPPVEKKLVKKKKPKEKLTPEAKRLQKIKKQFEADTAKLLKGEQLTEVKKKKPSKKKVSKKDAERRIAKTESGIVNDKKESAIIFDENGNEIWRKKGKKHEVSLTAADMAQIKGNTFTHNHPGGSGFSPSDVDVFASGAPKELRAVTKDYVYSMSGDPNPKGLTISGYKQAARRMEKGASADTKAWYKRQVDKGENPTPQDVKTKFDEYRHEGMEDLALSRGFKYERRKRENG